MSRPMLVVATSPHSARQATAKAFMLIIRTKQICRRIDRYKRLSDCASRRCLQRALVHGAAAVISFYKKLQS
jgi:hypothetical protein